MTGLPRRIAAVGAGRMGRGIALAFAYGGYEVALIDLKARTAADWATLRDEAQAEMHANLAMLAELDAMPRDAIARVLGRIRLVSEPEAPGALADAEVVFEGVPETFAAKQDALTRLCALIPGEAILASTTSTILPGDLAAFATYPERLLNAHWLNPAFVIPLVELSAHATTAPAAIARLRGLLEDIGKIPVLCAASPGYIVPRLQALVMNEAARMVEEGVASPEDIDRATRYGLGLRFAALGVIEFIDYGGNDILFYASRYLAERLSRERYQVPAIVERLMREGRNGLRSGEGFYDYRDRDVQAYRRD
ncbi:MAG: 3-hydroxybutyryl-CoA dehydrogenase, partial [Betaproteobacteria bacterium RIFCSPLOWO2_02_FULL_68_150]